MPAVMLLGYDMSIGRVMFVAMLGGLLGILMMIRAVRLDAAARHLEISRKARPVPMC
ncbi:MAG: hypothetical protein U0872_15600 [Planctomycetaceae bacterium]